MEQKENQTPVAEKISHYGYMKPSEELEAFLDVLTRMVEKYGKEILEELESAA